MEAILNNLIKAIGWSILHSLWQGAIIYGIMLLITMAIPKLKPKLKHNLAFGAISLIFICFCITFFSVFKFPIVSKPIPMAAFKDTNTSISAEYYQYVRSLPQHISNKTEQFFPHIVGVYSMGLLIQLLILGIGYKRMHKLKRAAHFAVPTEWKHSFEKLVLQVNLRQHINFYLSDKINVPLVIGYFKPVVLFPIGLAAQLDMDQVEAILIHELSHIRRNDYLLNLVKTAIETLLFFNPFVWLSGKIISIEREHACDDLVLKFRGNPMTYAHALLKLELLKDKGTPAFSMAATGKNQHLYQRIKRITDMKTNYMNARQQMFAITLAIATVVSLVWIEPSKAEKATTKVSQLDQIDIATSLKQEPTPPQPSKALKVPKASAIPNLPSSLLPKSSPKPPSTPIPNSNGILAPPATPVVPKHIDQDTTKKKVHYTIVTVDEKGNKKEYKSVKEMPENLRTEVLKESFINHNKSEIKTIIDTIMVPQSATLKRNTNSNRANTNNVKRPLNSKDMEKMQSELLKSVEKLGDYFDSKDWEKQEAALLRQMDKFEKNADKIEKRLKAAEEKEAKKARKR